MGSGKNKTKVPRKSSCESLRLALETREPSINRQREIASALYAVARQLGWRVQEFHWNQIAKSYHWADVLHGDRHFTVLFEQGSRVTALAYPVPKYPDRGFFDDHAFCDAVETVGDGQFRVAPAADLAMDLTDADRALIQKHSDVISADDMNYWKPQSVGEVLFNFWD